MDYVLWAVFSVFQFLPYWTPIGPQILFVHSQLRVQEGGVLQVESQTMAPHLLFWKSSELRVQQASGGSISLRRTANIELSKNSELRAWDASLRRVELSKIPPPLFGNLKKL